ncbi:unnamed protein product, partial [Porites lobata]
ELKRLIVKVQLGLMFRRRFLFYVAMICCLLYGWVYLTRHQSKSLQETAHKNTLSSIDDSSDQLEISDLIRLQPVQGFQLAPHNGLVEYLQPALCEVVPASLILYNRIFKTGSETLSFHFKLAAGMKNYRYIRHTTEDFYDKGIKEPYPEAIEELATSSRQQMFFNSHFYFRKYLKISRVHTYINQVREPVARFISHYAYMHNKRHRPPGRVQEMIDSGEWNDTIEQCFHKEGQGCKHNVMTRFFCGPELFCKNNLTKALENAKLNIVNHYAVVGLLEHFHLTLKIIQKRLPCFLPVIPTDPSFKLNQATTNTKTSVSEDMIEKIKGSNWADIKLYEFIKQVFWNQVKACKIPEVH